MSDQTTVGVGMIGYAFMGRVHSQAWRTVGAFFDLPLAPRMAVLAGRSKDSTAAAAAKLGWADVETDWREVVRRDDVQIIDICTPGDSHAEIAIAALEAGKHVICEKPLANSVAEAEAMVRAAAASTGRNMVAFNYRRVPAVALAHRLVAEGRLGEIRHVRAQYLQDWIADASAPLVWRLQKEKAGSGALGDIGAHIIDTTEFITGLDVVGVSALTETFVKERPVAAGSASMGPVTVDDAALFIARLDGGAVASFEATRFATGRKNALRIEVNGSGGSLAFDFEAMNELWVSEGDRGFKRILVTDPDDPYVGAWWPPGHGLGYEHTFTHEIKDFLEAIAEGSDPSPSFADGLRVQRVLAAVERSAADSSRFTAVEDVTS
ncbi:Gfo/Idh/MocA family protein [Nonomuraea rhizosphaerae]|uniref:Gfo/Idh/MocA family protein n=1 Tax=Nonomuraea rhizosphaerae TaxID=2665663 RepID=UPI001C5E027A|nr:Gfo/Idh/MocA family oxidoreductase [Nonomuraea rhizosphaerae]